MDQEYQKNEKFRELCYIGDMQLIKSFYSSSHPDLNSQNKVNGWTSLHWACSKNNAQLIQYLCEKGASKEIKNKDGKTPIEYLKDQDLRKNFGINHENSEETQKKPTLVPNFVRNPQFHYVDKSLFDSEPTKQTLEPEVNKKNSNGTTMAYSAPKVGGKEMVTIRIRSSFDEDFIEVDIDKQNLDFEGFKKLCRAELDHVSESYKIHKIRKLPNILVRNTNDIKRLQNEQEIEFVFVP
ncbi:ankyrin repeat domain-containing 40-like [Brachionus plicatilis]|uniref:Ankyrin repeat domain-containing 40-like n=1 Tax=Brachionus plicatilis TaxID=10195 RepID=A0A3M7SH73_BRAPC|nr:ankyrin repeat domain-containing 40-like [Brachionus plicatilis]